MRTTIALVSLLFLGTAAYAQTSSPWTAAKAKIRTHCQDKWPSDYDMQEYCQENAVDAFNKLADLSKNNGGIPSDTYGDILAKCLSEWTPWPGGEGRQDTYDFEMVHYCVDRQIKSYRKLNPPRSQ